MPLALDQRTAGGWQLSLPRRILRPETRPAAAQAPVPELHRHYSQRQGPNWLAIAIILIAHALLITALVELDIVSIGKPKKQPLVVELISLRPSLPAAAPVQKVASPEPKTSIVAPEAVIEVPPAAPPLVAMASEPAPVNVAIVAPPAPVAAPAGAVRDGDLASKMLSAPPPRVPIESRRKKEHGTVVLTVLVDAAGRVNEIDISRSSGFPRLDKAALEAVRRWRWSPTLVAGAPVMVRGVVEIPFVLPG